MLQNVNKLLINRQVPFIDQNLAKGYKVDPTDTNRNITLTVSTGYSQTVPSLLLV